MQTKIKKIWNAATTVLVSLMVILSALLWGYRLLGLQAFVVQSGSMEPACPVGSLVYVGPAEAAELRVGDIITFDLGSGIRGTHRIVEIGEHEGTPAFVTKGDANEHIDAGLVLPESIIGRVVFTVPYLGFAAAFLQQPSALYVKVAAVAGVMLLLVLPDILFAEKKKKPKQEDKS